MATAANDTSARNGIMIRVRTMVRAALSGSKPGAISRTRRPAPTMPMAISTDNTTISTLSTREASRCAASFPPSCRAWV
jgi:hypothetical protein